MTLPADLPIHAPGDGTIEILDQTRLPHAEVRLRIADIDGLCEAIRALRVRGAPLLGLCGAYGMALASTTSGPGNDSLATAAERLRATRPTAVDLGNAIDTALATAFALPEGQRTQALWASALAMHERQFAIDEAMGRHGADLLQEAAAVLTHCNTGALATGALGTALAVVREAHLRGHLAHCYADETRPLLQGARLTAWELERMGAPYSILPDSAAASLIASGSVAAAITGADRIARNGDAANKVGTFGVALACARHGVPFYIAAPRTTFDRAADNGAGIPIEHRSADEVHGFGAERWAPEAAGVFNPAFDVTPADLIAGIITEHGVLRPPFDAAITAMLAIDVPVEALS